MPAQIEAFLDPASSTYSYVVYETDGGQCAIVDPVLDYDGAAGRTRPLLRQDLEIVAVIGFAGANAITLTRRGGNGFAERTVGLAACRRPIKTILLAG